MIMVRLGEVLLMVMLSWVIFFGSFGLVWVMWFCICIWVLFRLVLRVKVMVRVSLLLEVDWEDM